MPENFVLKFIARESDKSSARFLLFQDPEYTIETYNSLDALLCLKRLDGARNDGFHVAGYFAYEALNCIHNLSHNQSKKPLIWMGAFKKLQIIYEDDFNSVFDDLAKNFECEDFILSHEKQCEKFSSDSSFEVSFDLKNRYTKANEKYNELKKDKSSFSKALNVIKKKLKAGDTYQVNYTKTNEWSFSGNAIKLFQFLLKQQPTDQSALVVHDNRAILSHSPESFFAIYKDNNKHKIICKPMKGTSARSEDAKTDSKNLNDLIESEKTKAENLMIVDLMRNDLGQVAVPGSVQVEKLFKTQTHPTLHQMISIISATIEPLTSQYIFEKLFQYVFPAGSITGAPKLASQKIIKELENKDRGIYTGCIGYALCENKTLAKKSNEDRALSNDLETNNVSFPIVDFNVCIRTIDIDLKKNKASLGSGCGIVFDSNINDEWQEYLIKSAFVVPAFESFHLIETMLLFNGEIRLQDFHLARLKKSIGKVFKKDSQTINAQIHKIKNDLNALKRKYAKGKYKIRIVYFRNQIKFNCDELIQNVQKINLANKKVLISPENIYSGSPFCSIKSGQRMLYDVYFQKAKNMGYQDILFFNEKEEVVEGAIHNILICNSQKKWQTPYPNSGALEGTALKSLMQNHAKITYATLYLKDLKEARAVFFINGINGLQRVKVDFTKQV